MTRYQGIVLISIFVTLLVINGCIFQDSELVDITAPEIEVSYPEAGTHFVAGGFVQFEGTFRDDLELGSYSIDIHDNLDGHGHGRIASPSDDPSLIWWSSKNNFTIPEGYIIYNAQHNDDIEISANALAGPYHFIVQAVDNAGNATSFQDGSTVELEVFITNDSQPVVNITNLQNDELEIEQGVLFMVEGDISDPTIGDYAGMHFLEVILGETHEEEGQHAHLRKDQDGHEDLIDEYFGDTDLESFMIDGVIQLNQVFEFINFTLSQEQLDELIAENIDHLQLTLKVKDEQGNLTISSTIVHIHTS